MDSLAFWASLYRKRNVNRLRLPIEPEAFFFYSMENIIRRILRYFFSGTVFIVPLVATAYFIYVSFRWLDNLLDLPYPGLGFVIILLAITGFGYLTTNFAFKTAADWFDQLMNKIPI